MSIIQNDINFIYGTNNPDALTGTSGADRIEAYEGADFINASSGNDTIIGGSDFFVKSGWDTVWYGVQGISRITLSSSAGDGIYLNPNSFTVIKYDSSNNIIGTDSLAHFSNLNGTRLSDTFAINDRTSSGQGNLNISGYGGSDTFTFNAGITPAKPQPVFSGNPFINYNWVLPDSNNHGITLNWSGGTQATVAYGANSTSGQSAGVDTIVGGNYVAGSGYDDTIDYSKFTNGWFGYTQRPIDGADRSQVSYIYSGGNDTLIGNGNTILSIGSINPTKVDGTSGGSGITASLLSGSIDLSALNFWTATSGGVWASHTGGIINFTGVDGLGGTPYNDMLIGGQSNANDREWFLAGAGNDTIDGGGGFDVAFYNYPFNTWNAGGVIRIQSAGLTVNMALGTVDTPYSGPDSSIPSGALEHDILRHVESVSGTDYADIYDARGFSGASANAGSWGTYNEFTPIGGDDVIYGNGNTMLDYRTSLLPIYANLFDSASGFGFVDALNSVDKTSSDYGRLGRDVFNQVEINNLAVAGVWGSVYDDKLVGSDNGDRQIQWFMGSAGNDTIDGGAGRDGASFADSVQGIRVDLSLSADQVQNDGWGTVDQLLGVEAILGSYFGDVITGSSATEFFLPSKGNDSVDGGAGLLNKVGYSDYREVAGAYVQLGASPGVFSAPAGVSSNSILSGWEGFAVDGWGGIDQLRNIQGVEGSNYADTLIGDSRNNRLDGRGGDDSMDGGEGFDTVEYDQSIAGVIVNLTQQTASDGYGGTDTLRNIEAVLGSVYGDNLTGTASSNLLQGDAGNDSINGFGGADSLDGGLGDDTFQLIASSAWTSGFSVRNDYLWNVGVQSAADKTRAIAGMNRFESVIQGGEGVDKILGTSGSDVVAVDDIFSGIYSGLDPASRRWDAVEELQLGDGNDLMDGTSNRIMPTTIVSMTVRGGNGDDVFWGGNFNSAFYGDAGNDTLIGGRGNDTLTGGDGADVFVFASQSDNDVIMDFNAAQDKIRLLGSNHDVAPTQQLVGDNMVLTWNGVTITLTGITSLPATGWLEHAA